MHGGRGKLPVLAEIAGPAPGETGVWSLRREDFEALEQLLDRLGDNRVLVVTGGDIAAALAVALAGVAAARGRRTALLECDLGRPQLAADLGLSAAPGLHEYLRWEATAPDVLQPVVLAGPASPRAGEPLVCITAGRRAEDPATLLGLGSFRHMTAKLREAYDLLVIVGPDLESGGAGLGLVAAQADALLAGVLKGASRRRWRRLRATVRGLPAPAIGAVVVGADEQ